jgi:hypothetical protein
MQPQVAGDGHLNESRTTLHDKPNVLFIMTDQHRADLMTCAERDLVPMPKIDRIAARGARFSHAYCPYPVCLASRSSLLTGLYPHHTGAINNNDRLDWRIRTMARAGEEVYMGGGYVPVSDEWVPEQIPEAYRRSYFVVGNEVRPNVRQDAELFSTDIVVTEVVAILFPHYGPTLDEQVTGAQSIGGKLVAYDHRRCLHLQTASFGPFTFLWPPEWSLQVVDGTAVVTDQEGVPRAWLANEVLLRARAVPHSCDSPVYRQLVDELPGDCSGANWLVDEMQTRP